MKLIRSCNTGLYRVERTLAIISFITMIGLMFLQVLCRYVLHTALAWSEETMRFLFIFTSFFGAGCCTYEHKHVVIDFLGTIVRGFIKDERKQEMIFSFVDIIVSLISTGFFVYMGGVMFQYSLDLQAKNQLSAAMLMPLHWLGLAITVALFCCAIHFFLEIMIAASDFLSYKKEGKQ